MSLSTKIAAAVDRQGAGAGASLPCEVSAEHDGHRLALQLTAAGPVGLAFDALEFAADGRETRSPEAVRAWADRLARKVTYLMEPLVAIEHDRDGGELAMRSQAPTVRNGRRTYYEARLRGDGTLKLTRVVYDEATRSRQSAPCQMTLEVLERLADDLVACAG
jgi:hypothetical protein